MSSHQRRPIRPLDRTGEPPPVHQRNTVLFPSSPSQAHPPSLRRSSASLSNLLASSAVVPPTIKTSDAQLINRYLLSPPQSPASSTTSTTASSFTHTSSRPSSYRNTVEFPSSSAPTTSLLHLLKHPTTSTLLSSATGPHSLPVQALLTSQVPDCDITSLPVRLAMERWLQRSYEIDRKSSVPEIDVLVGLQAVADRFRCWLGQRRLDRAQSIRVVQDVFFPDRVERVTVQWPTGLRSNEEHVLLGLKARDKLVLEDLLGPGVVRERSVPVALQTTQVVEAMRQRIIELEDDLVVQSVLLDQLGRTTAPVNAFATDHQTGQHPTCQDDKENQKEEGDDRPACCASCVAGDVETPKRKKNKKFIGAVGSLNKIIKTSRLGPTTDEGPGRIGYWRI